MARRVKDISPDKIAAYEALGTDGVAVEVFGRGEWEILAKKIRYCGFLLNEKWSVLKKLANFGFLRELLLSQQ
jgi:hypothetical protein